MIDLNGQEFKQVSIFNGGKAGLVRNTTITVEKKDSSDTSGKPDFNLIIADEDGAKLREGFYYFKGLPNENGEDAKKRWSRELGRIMHIARAVMGNDFQFPAVNTQQEAYDVAFDIIRKGAVNQTFNVFVTYGSTNYVNKGGYLKLRYFDFIENGKTENTRLKVKPGDLLERIIPDTEQSSTIPGSINLNNNSTFGSTSVQSWTS